MDKTYYELLQVTHSANREVLKAAYEALVAKVRSNHVLPDQAAQELNQQLDRAYEVLSDPKTRAIYDEGLASSANTTSELNQAPMPAVPYRLHTDDTHVVNKNRDPTGLNEVVNAVWKTKRITGEIEGYPDEITRFGYVADVIFTNTRIIFIGGDIHANALKPMMNIDLGKGFRNILKSVSGENKIDLRQIDEMVLNGTAIVGRPEYLRCEVKSTDFNPLLKLATAISDSTDVTFLGKFHYGGKDISGTINIELIDDSRSKVMTMLQKSYTGKVTALKH